MGLSSFLNFVPHNAGTQSLGAHSRAFAMCHATRVFTQQILATADTLRIGTTDPSLGLIQPWWDIVSSTLTPVGDRGIGTSAAPVQTVTATSVNTGIFSLLYEANPFISFKVTNKGIHSVPEAALNLVIETQNDLCPVSANTFDLGLPGARWHDTFTRRS